MNSYDAASRRFTHELVDLLFDHVSAVSAGPVVEWSDAASLRDRVRLDGAISDPLELARLVARHAIQLHHPSYMGHQVCPPFAIAAAADLLISTLNQSTAVFEMSPIGTVIENEVVRWFADLAGYPEEAEGTAVSGGSAANLTALMAARARWMARGGTGDPAILTSADAHYSVARAAAIMGFGTVVKIATDEAHRMDPGALAAAVATHRGQILAVVGTAGSTATGAFDDLTRLREIAGHAWLHVDAAHGASVLLSEKLRNLAAGLGAADSMAWDPHKMLWMPLSLGIVLVRDGVWLRRAFEADAPYLFHAGRENVNIGAMTIQCSKRADAVKFWLALKTLGTAPFAAALEKVAEVTRYLYERVRDSDDFVPLHVPDFNIFCFRWRGTDEENGALREALIRSGEAWITSTVLKGQRVLRVTMINPRTEREHVDAMLESVRRIAKR